MFENRKVNGYIYATRFIASWLNEGGQLRHKKDVDDFYNWLLSTGISEDDAKHIKDLATNGKLELENSARIWLDNK